MDFETLNAVTARILPSGPGPGARETGVAEYVEKTLEQPHAKKLRGPMHAGLALIERAAVEQHGRSFHACDEAQQDEILRALQAQELDSPEFPAHWFFEILITMSLEGFLCDPKHGGNRDGLGWRFFGANPSPPTSPPFTDEAPAR